MESYYKLIGLCICTFLSYHLFSQSTYNLNEKTYSLSDPKITSANPAQPQDTMRESLKDNAGDDSRDVLNNFNASFGLLGDKASTDLGVSVATFPLYLSTKKDSVKYILASGAIESKLRVRRRYLNLSFLNRAALNFDSFTYIANTYLLSLNPSPATIRLDYTFNLSSPKTIDTNNPLPPSYSFQFQTDGRLIPYADTGGQTELAGSFHLYGTLRAIFQSNREFAVSEVDNGFFYVEPSIYLVFTSNKLYDILRQDKEKKPILGLDFRIGYKSEKNSFNDIGLSGYYTLNKIFGPRFQIGLDIKPN